MGECFKFGRGKVLLYDPVFANNSWEDIISACQSGKVPNTWIVGCQKNMTINGTDYPIDIIGINHDTYSDGSGTAPLTFQMHDCYGTKYPMHTTSSNTCGWSSCSMRTSTLPTILKLMPAEVQAAVKNVNKITTVGNQSSSTSTTADSLFLLSEIELFGNYYYSPGNEGSQYIYYAAGGATARRKNLGGNTCYWWERSPRLGDAQSFDYVTSSGSWSYQYASGNYGVAPAFCF